MVAGEGQLAEDMKMESSDANSDVLGDLLELDPGDLTVDWRYTPEATIVRTNDTGLSRQSRGGDGPRAGAGNVLAMRGGRNRPASKRTKLSEEATKDDPYLAMDVNKGTPFQCFLSMSALSAPSMGEQGGALLVGHQSTR